MPEYGTGPEDHAWYAGRLAPGARLEVWVDEARTDRVMQIKDPQGVLYPDGIVVCDDLGRYTFDTVNTYEDLWISPVGSTRGYRLRRADMGVRLGTVEATTGTLTTSVDSLTSRMDVVEPQAASANQAATTLQNSIGQPFGLAPLDDVAKVPLEHLPDSIGQGGTTGYLNVLDYGAVGDGIADDTTAIRTALNEAANRPAATVYMPPHRTFLISGPLYVQRRTRILAHGATIKRDGTGWMLINRHPTEEPTAEGYDGHGDITVEGGLWDANGSSEASGGYANCFSFGHGRSLIFRDLTIRDVPGNHAIEVNACEGVTIDNCRFEGFSHDGDRGFSEAIQLDLMKGSAYFGAFGPYDHTPCRNVSIRSCWFGASPEAGAGARSVVPWARGIGSHSSTIGLWHHNILIEGCWFEGLSQWAVGAYNWREAAITNNVVVSCGGGMWVRVVDSGDTNDTLDADGVQTSASQDAGNMVLAGNIFRALTGYGPAIDLEGEDTGRIVRTVVSHNMVRGVTSQTGIRGEYLNTCRMVGNVVADSDATGLSMLALDDTVLSDNSVQRAGGAGLTVDNRPTGQHVALSGNMLMDSGENGLWLLGGTHYLVEGNIIVGSSRNTDQAHQGIRITTSANGVSLIGNRVRQRPGAANNPAWGLSISSTALNVRRGDNDFTVSGVVGEVDDQQTTGWIAPTFENSWTNHGSGFQTARYRKDMAGRIFVEGVITGGTAGTVAFTLPTDMRPGASRAFTCISSTGATPTVSRVVVASDGTVTPNTNIGSFVSLEFTFEAADI